MLIDVIRKQITVIKIGIETIKIFRGEIFKYLEEFLELMYFPSRGDVDYLVKESIGSFDTISLIPKKVVCFLSFQDLLS